MHNIDVIIELEWEQFSNVKGIDGKASCQEDRQTFDIMRRSQMLAWSDELLESYQKDVILAKKKGHNMQTEKYARMMKKTDYEEYKKIEDALPVLSEEQELLAAEITKIKVTWMEDFAKEFPNIAGRSRSIRSNTDNINNTSYETYLNGELLTYSIQTLKIYLTHVKESLKENKNLAKIIMENTVKLYGYEDLEQAEMEEMLSTIKDDK